ncbi:MAG TPA: gliding motility-associated C-terminal domain-containing protein [Brumimicrobium sp.]|nr:gliding motility-associated C-terminal domain-containing protein [Brumimicrobium sp.]
MKATYLLYLLFSCISLNVTSQTVFYQDICNCGVTGGGFSTGGGSGNGTVELYIEPGSTIRKAFLIAFSVGEKPINDSVSINGTQYHFSVNEVISSFYVSNFLKKNSIYVKEITNNINPSQINYNVTIPLNLNLTKLTSVFLYIVYEKSSLPKTATSIFINNKDLTSVNTIYNSNTLIPIDNTNPVAFSIYSDIIGCSGDLGSNIYVNNNHLGLLKESDAVNSTFSCAGVKGHFYFQNNQLFGLDDDTPDNIMGGSDGLADISLYINNNTTSLDWKFIWENLNTSNAHDYYLSFFLTYTSPCDTFSTTLTSDTTLCHGETLQLQATGGVSTGSNTGYEWTAISGSAAVDDLSCTDCPNPVFSGDSSQVYTVRIWNTDSCSVVKPVRISVSHPQEINAKMFRSVCSFSTGKIVLEDLPNNVIQLGAVNPNGDTISPNSSNDFIGLSAGDYTVFYIDKFGCSNDTSIYVEPVISTVAQFNAYPKKGSAPIQINLSNQSQNATDYSWWLNGEYQGNSFSGFYTDTSGVYDIELIAWKTDSICADTASFTVLVFDSLVAQLPNVFTPNNDGTNDFFNVKVNLPVSYKLSILNRWGNVVFENKGELIEGTHKLWNGTAKNGDLVTDGTYFYTISFALDRETVDCEISECEVSKEGFVQVFGE